MAFILRHTTKTCAYATFHEESGGVSEFFQVAKSIDHASREGEKLEGLHASLEQRKACGSTAQTIRRCSTP
jgi:hypothetical protein